MTPVVVVTGATGTIGRPLTATLLAAGARVRALTRDANTVLPPSVERVLVDPARPDPAVLPRALRGATAVFCNPRAVGEDAGSLLALARDAGVPRAVALAAINVDDDPDRQPSRFRGDRNREVERAVVASGVAWVSLRPTVFAINTAGLWGAQLRAGNAVRGPYPTAAAAVVDERDVALAAARVLLDDGFDGRRLDLTGPQSLTQVDQLAVLGDVLGRPLEHHELPPAVARAAMVEQGFPPGFADAFLRMQADAAAGPAAVADDLGAVLGRAPTPFARWAADHAHLFGATAGGTP